MSDADIREQQQLRARLSELESEHRDLDDVIDQLISEGVVFNCAGGLMIENPLILPFLQRVEGSEESVMGISSTLLDSLFNSLR